VVRPIMMTWLMADKTAFRCPVLPNTCSFCGKKRIVVLPPPLAALQDDGTTHVCHPSIGGCNQGYEMIGPFAQAELASGEDVSVSVKT
jgi:hypothetical protein